jgi:hypothetical protein
VFIFGFFLDLSHRETALSLHIFLSLSNSSFGFSSCPFWSVQSIAPLLTLLLLFFVYPLSSCAPPPSAMGAAVGATAGGMRGLGERRRERMIGRF